MLSKIKNKVEIQNKIRNKEVKGDWEDTENDLKVFERWEVITREERKELLKALKK